MIKIALVLSVLLVACVDDARPAFTNADAAAERATAECDRRARCEAADAVSCEGPEEDRLLAGCLHPGEPCTPLDPAAPFAGDRAELEACDERLATLTCSQDFRCQDWP